MIPESIIHMRVKFAFSGYFDFGKNSKCKNDENTPGYVSGKGKHEIKIKF
jgi:hypothetical protein